MKLSPALLLGTLLFTAALAQARPAAQTAAQELDADLAQYTSLFANFDCTFAAQAIRGGYLVRIVDEKKNTLEVAMTGLDTLKLRAKEDADGSFQHVFRLATGAMITFTHFDDAYDHVTISNGQQSLTCEADY